MSNILSSGGFVLNSGRVTEEQAAANLKRYQISKGRAAKAAAKAAKQVDIAVDKVALTAKRYGVNSLAAQLATKGVFL